MLSDTTIANVEETLIMLLRNNLRDLVDNPDEQIVPLSPADVADQQIRLTLFLYSLVETPSLRNEPFRSLNSKESRFPPLSLDLYYMLTCYASTTADNLTDRTLDTRLILGRAMRVFYDNGILSGTILQGDLAETQEELRITLNPITVEDLTRIWSVFPDTSYRTSVSYLVTPVRIRSERIASAQRVISKETEHDRIVPNNASR